MMAVRLSEALELFLEARAAEGKKTVTLDWYRRRLTRFVTWVGDISLDAVNLGIIRGFLAFLQSETKRYKDHPYKPGPMAGGLSAASINGYARAMRQFFNFLAAEGLTESNLMARIKLPKLGKRAPKAIDFQNVIKLLAAADDSVCPERDRAILMFLSDTGCRVGGLIGLELDALDVDKRRALVTEKGDKSRRVYFSEATRAALVRWLEVRSTWLEVEAWVFPSHHTGGQLTVSGVNQLLKRLRQRAGVEGRVNPHAFRHGFAKDYLMSGGDLASLADLMGHESVETTRSFYAVFSDEDLRRKHDLFTVGRWGDE